MDDIVVIVTIVRIVDDSFIVCMSVIVLVLTMVGWIDWNHWIARNVQLEERASGAVISYRRRRSSHRLRSVDSVCRQCVLIDSTIDTVCAVGIQPDGVRGLYEVRVIVIRR